MSNLISPISNERTTRTPRNYLTSPKSFSSISLLSFLIIFYKAIRFGPAKIKLSTWVNITESVAFSRYITLSDTSGIKPYLPNTVRAFRCHSAANCFSPYNKLNKAIIFSSEYLWARAYFVNSLKNFGNPKNCFI